MKSVNNSCGAMSVFFDPEDHPGLFEKDNSYILKEFDLYGRKCALITEGSKVTLLSEPGKLGEKELLSLSLPSAKRKKINSLILKWYNNSLSLHASVCLTKKGIVNA